MTTSKKAAPNTVAKESRTTSRPDLADAPRFSPGQFCSVDLNARDLDAAVVFYSGLFDWTFAPEDTGGGPRYGLFRLGGDVVAGIGEMSDELRTAGAPSVWGSYVRVDDVHETSERATELGATVLVPPMPVMHHGWVAYLEDPTGAAIGVWQSGAFTGADRVGVPGSFCWNELVTPDLEAAEAFYGPLFGWTFADHGDSEEPYRIISRGDAEAGGMMPLTEEWGGVRPHWSVYFAVADVDASTDRLQTLGGEIRHGPFDTSVGRIAVAADAQGAAFNLIALSTEA